MLNPTITSTLISRSIPENWYALLCDPFDPQEVGFLPKGKQPYNGKMVAFPYIDARSVQERLDTVIGPANWTTSFSDVVGGGTRCILGLRVGPENDPWVYKTNVGYNDNERELQIKIKGAHSDAFKRVNVDFGVGRYLYWIDKQWISYDVDHKCFTPAGLEQTRRNLPAFAKPKLILNGKILPPVTEEDVDDSQPEKLQSTHLSKPEHVEVPLISPAQPPLKKVISSGESAEDKNFKAQEELYNLLASHLSKCTTEKQLQSSWMMANDRIKSGAFTDMQVEMLTNHKNLCKSRLQAEVAEKANV